MNAIQMTFDPARARSLTPLSELHEKNLALICARARVDMLPANGELQAVDEHRSLIYLLRGRLSLQHGRERIGEIEAASDEAQHPLFQGERGNCRAQAVGEVLIARVEREQLEILLRQQTSAATRVHDVRVGDAENRVFDAILEAFENNNLQMPALPEVALRVRKAVVVPETSVEDVVRIVQTDPVLATRLVQIANSPIYRRGGSVSSLKMAIGRLGLEATRKLATVLAVKQLFNGKSTASRRCLSRIYKEATAVAALCNALARRSGCADPETALLAGLVFDIGAVPIIAHAVGRLNAADELHVLEACIARLSQTVSHWVLAAWDFDEQLVETPLGVRDWQRTGSAGPDFTDLVNAALLHRSAGAVQGSPLPLLEETPLAAKLRAAGVEILDGRLLLAEDEVAEVQSLLG